MKHEKNDVVRTKDEWLTPPELISSLGGFDLDPCSPVNRPWPTAKIHYTIIDNGLLKEWFGRVWMNPPYGNKLIHWLNRMAMHGDGIALTFARTDTKAFHHYVFGMADSIFFLKERLKFYHVTGERSTDGIAPSVLIAYGGSNSEAINEAGLMGAHLPINRIGITIVGYDATWKSVIKTVFIRLNRPAELNELYCEVIKIAPEKVARNKHFKAKVRQTVQLHFLKLTKGVYKL